ncbi:signal transduction histidine kinase [Nitrosospira sp. Nsp5]|uniref:histidine kinase n=2 Tax=Nitrosospira TaxID=35798 RepID=A0ABY0TFD1_9PROT|nr:MULTISPECIES: HAMP domain-containing sensor histidine kinase [Nitrosospira]PTR08477.1 signal transduction histidine kinase [Nitrosospira sp. Nsp5]SDQ52814.1 Signal transduction histidine kinase [Nitrosospira multiformis]
MASATASFPVPGFKRGLRLRVALAFAVFCIVVVGTLGISLYIASDDIEEAHIEQIIETEMDYLLQRYRERADFVPQVGSNLEKYIVHDSIEESQLPSYLQGLNYRRHKVFRGPEEVRVAVRHVDGVKFLVAYEIGLHDQRQQELRLLIVLSLLSVVGVALVVGYLLAGLLVKQVTDLAERVRHLAPGDVQGTTMIQPGQDEEVAQLAHALDDYQNRITRMLRREQEFTANVSHELRTPITTILTSCELLVTEPNLSERTRSRIGMIEAAATRMGEQLQALLFLAREQALGIMEPVALAECVYDAVEPVCTEIYRKRLIFEVAIAPKAVLTLNRQALHTALVNLLRNAVQYTERGFIRVNFSRNRLSISDSGIGIEPFYMPLLYERFFRGSSQGEGLGIGLAIVKRICDHYGWTIEVESTPGKGATFHITFPS